jgi:hypothetical protein
MAADDDANPIPAPAPLTWRLVIPGLRRLFVVAGFLVLMVGSSLFFFTERTDRYFAWTIATPLPAAFLGAGYLASAGFEWLAARERVWVRVRVTVSAVMVFTVLTLVVTLLHVERFHFGPEHAAITRAGTWLWTLIYAIVPLVLAGLLVGQRRAPGTDPPRTRPLSRPVRAVVGTQATVLLVLGAGLFLWPSDVAEVWPWALTTLTAQAIAAWLLGVGVGMAHAVGENDVDRVRGAGTSNLLIAGLQLVALARYSGDLASPTKGMLYVAFLLSMVAVGLYLRFSHPPDRAAEEGDVATPPSSSPS